MLVVVGLIVVAIIYFLSSSQLRCKKCGSGSLVTKKEHFKLDCCKDGTRWDWDRVENTAQKKQLFKKGMFYHCLSCKTDGETHTHLPKETSVEDLGEPIQVSRCETCTGTGSWGSISPIGGLATAALCLVSFPLAFISLASSGTSVNCKGCDKRGWVKNR